MTFPRPLGPLKPPMPRRHPEALPQYRTCPDCSRFLLLSSENFALRKGPGRYPGSRPPTLLAASCANRRT